MGEFPAAGAPPWAPSYRHVTADVPSVAFRFRTRPEDFRVEEVPLAPLQAGDDADTVGTHVVYEVEKRGLSTVEAVRRIATALGVAEGSVGFAGRKDAFAVTRQWITIEHVDPGRVEALELPGIKLRVVGRQGKKLRLGQLAGNRFRLRLVGLEPADRARLDEMLGRLADSGLPNYYGSQRFGKNGVTYRLGRLLVQRRAQDYLTELVSPEQTVATPAVEELAAALTAGRATQRRLGRLAPVLPADLGRLARQLARRPGDLDSALRAIPKRTRRFHLSAFQSRVFNRVLASRLAAGLPIDRCVAGDVAFEHATGRTLPVEDRDLPERDEGSGRGDLDARARSFEISPTGPMPGPRAATVAGVPAEIERAALGAEGVEHGDFEGLPEAFASSGARRPLRVALTELATEWQEDGVELAFRLPPGAFATTLLEELRKEYRVG